MTGSAAGPGRHPEIGPELRALAQSILDRLDPGVRAAAAAALSRDAGSGRCQQRWCPVCALAAIVTGEEHPLLAALAEHSVALLTVVRAAVGAPQTSAAPGAPQAGSAAAPPQGAPPAPPGQYQHIDVELVPDDGKPEPKPTAP